MHKIYAACARACFPARINSGRYSRWLWGNRMKSFGRVHQRVLLSGLVALGLTACGGGGGPGTPTPALTPSPAPTPAPTSSFAPSDGTFYWTSSAPLIAPQADPSQTVYGVKDPSVVFANGKYHVFLTTAGSKGWGIAYTSFADWSSASTAPIFPLDKSPIGRRRFCIIGCMGRRYPLQSAPVRPAREHVFRPE